MNHPVAQKTMTEPACDILERYFITARAETQFDSMTWWLNGGPGHGTFSLSDQPPAAAEAAKKVKKNLSVVIIIIMIISWLLSHKGATNNGQHDQRIRGETGRGKLWRMGTNTSGVCIVKLFFATFPFHALIHERCSSVGTARFLAYHLILRSWDSNPHHVSRVAPTGDLLKDALPPELRRYGKTFFLESWLETLL